MTLITCSECGRAVSDKARYASVRAAPLTTSSSAIDLVAKRSNAPPPTREQIKRRALLSLSILAVGLIWAVFLDHHPGSRLALFMAALLIIGGLCWVHGATRACSVFSAIVGGTFGPFDCGTCLVGLKSKLIYNARWWVCSRSVTPCRLEAAELSSPCTQGLQHGSQLPLHPKCLAGGEL